MNNGAKIRLSDAEIKLVGDASWILTKNSIMARAVEMMAGLHKRYRGIWEDGVEGVGASEPKISKGENYLGLPYVILDYPRIFGKEDVFAIRTFFWWGHGWQLILHVKGKYKILVEEALVRGLPVLGQLGFRVCVGDDEWRHEMDGGNYTALVGGMAEWVRGRDWVKIAVPVELEKWNEMVELMAALFERLVVLLGC